MLGAITFTYPALLWALLGLPALYWLLRITPPRPQEVSFPPFQLLLGLRDQHKQAHHTPWWLLLLRLALAALIILAATGPQRPENLALADNQNSRLIILDDTWVAAHNWQERLSSVQAILADAKRQQAQVSLALTTYGEAQSQLTAQSVEEVRARLARLQPQARAPDRQGLLKALQRHFTMAEPLEILWISDGIEFSPSDQNFAQELRKLNQAQVRLSLYQSDSPIFAIQSAQLENGDVNVNLFATNAAIKGPEKEIEIAAQAANGRILRQVPITMVTQAQKLKISLPLEIRNELAAIHILNQNHAGSVHLLDDRIKRKRIGMLSGQANADTADLLSPLHYLTRALEPFAEISANQNSITNLLQQNLSMLILADINIADPPSRQAINDFLEKGGLLVRFAGPNMAQNPDPFLPVNLRGGREIGGSMGWETPQSLAPFAQISPFRDLKINSDIRVRRQLLAEPEAGLADKTWALLSDGTPIITAKKQAKGLIILFHITANPDWSNLPLSGLYVEMLQKLIELAPNLGQGLNNDALENISNNRNAAFTPIEALNGFGDLGPMPPQAEPIEAQAMQTTRVSLAHPAGLYMRAGERRALNLSMPENGLNSLNVSADVSRDFAPSQRQDFTPLIWAAAFILFLIDCLVSLLRFGGGLNWRQGLGLIFLAHILWLGLNPPSANAQTPNPALETSLGFVITGDAEVDLISRQGLLGLGRDLASRTAIEPGPPQGVNILTDELSFYPLLYWPVLPDAQALPPSSANKLQAFLQQGGMVIFDTRDASGNDPLQAASLARLLTNLSIPPLEPVASDHVLTRSFFLLNAFPGRFAASALWVEKRASASADNVSSILITSNDFAGAWAMDENNDYLLPVTPGGEGQREMAFRTGVNIVMYALTGNYKADQIHVPALLERLGQ